MVPLTGCGLSSSHFFAFSVVDNVKIDVEWFCCFTSSFVAELSSNLVQFCFSFFVVSCLFLFFSSFFAVFCFLSRPFDFVLT